MEMDDHSAVIDVSGAKILGCPDSRSPPIFLPRQPAAASPMVALDIGGSLIKLVYTASRSDGSDGVELRFVTFERRRLDDCFEFLRAEGLIKSNIGMPPSLEKVMLKATGGGSHKFADKFQEKLGVFLEKVDELESMVSGANFLLKNIPGAAFTHRNGMKSTVDINSNSLFPYLLVTVGTGVSILKVTGNKNFEIVTGTHISGATMFGLAKLLTGCKSYDEFLQLSQKGDNFVLDSIVKDVCGEVVCQKEGLSMSALAYSFGKVINSKKNLCDYKPEDLASTLLTAFTCNIAQIAFLLASFFGFKRVFFGGSFIYGHKTTMENISSAINVWSECQLQAIFLQHEGYLGALGLLVSYGGPTVASLTIDEEIEKDSLQDSPALHGTSEDGNSDSNVFPYLLVHVGSGVSMIEVNGKGEFKRIMGSHLGGGSILGLARLLLGCSSYEGFLELAERGNKLNIDLTIADIYGEQGYPQCGFPASTIVATFGKVNSSKLSGYKREDLAASLLNFFTHNTGQVVYLVAKLLRLNRIFFRGAYVCSHKKTMDEMSDSIKKWSKGKIQMTFMCHEGFLGTMGTFCSYEAMGIDSLAGAEHEDTSEVLLGFPYTGLFPSFPLTHRQEAGENLTFQGEMESLNHENPVLKVEVDHLQLHSKNVGLKAKLIDNVVKDELGRLQKENAELKAKLVGISGDAGTM